MASGVGAKAVHSAYNSMSALRGDLCRIRAAANCFGTPVGAVLQMASNKPRLVPKRWINVAGTTPASFATWANVSCVGLNRCMARAVAARISSSDVSRGRGDILPRSLAGAVKVRPRPRHARITEWLFTFHLTLMNGHL